MDYEAVIGMEVHAQLLTDTKIFCSCSTKFGSAPNTNVCPVCTGMPGSLPVLNKKVVDFAIKLGLAVKGRINKRSIFARKNYFYPDLPKGYQISQLELPIVEDGVIEFYLGDEKKKVALTRIHMEEDAGKLIHGAGSNSHSYVDLNRAGVPLLEIVSEPEIYSPAEAAAYVKAIRSIVRYLGVSDGNMDEGSMRADANISIRPVGAKELGVKVEIKNMNSFKHIEKALDYEIERQTAVLESGGKIYQETRLWDTVVNKTFSMRSKEEANDYRYFPEPDLVFLDINDEWEEEIRVTVPELPLDKKERYESEFNLPSSDAEVLTGEKTIADFFEESVKLLNKPKIISNWIMSELLRELNEEGIGIEKATVTPALLVELVKLIEDGTISGKIGKTVFSEMYKTGKSPNDIVKEKGLIQITDEGEIEKIIDSIIENSPNEVEKYRAGKKGLMGFFVGQVMKETRGKANPGIVNKILVKKLEG